MEYVTKFRKRLILSMLLTDVNKVYAQREQAEKMFDSDCGPLAGTFTLEQKIVDVVLGDSIVPDINEAQKATLVEYVKEYAPLGDKTEQYKKEIRAEPSELSSLAWMVKNLIPIFRLGIAENDLKRKTVEKLYAQITVGNQPDDE